MLLLTCNVFNKVLTYCFELQDHQIFLPSNANETLLENEFSGYTTDLLLNGLSISAF